MYNKLVLTGALAMVLAAPAWAQTSTTTPTTTRSGAPAVTSSPSQIDAHKLIGQSVQNEADNKTVGKIDSVMMDSNGTAKTVVLGVGGFLGIGKKDIAVDWNQIHVADNGRKVTMNADKDQLKAMPEYVWPKDHPRGSVWTASDSDRRVAPATTSSGSTGMAPAPAIGTGTTTTAPATTGTTVR